jgi:tetratricopeptide (TPR) repeat protein
MRIWRRWTWWLVWSLAATGVSAAPLTHGQALAAIAQPDAAVRLAGAVRLGAIGVMADADKLLVGLRDGDPRVREACATALWQVWSRSGDAAVDKLFARGVMQMQSGALEDALGTFSEIVRRKPDFAEGWNKRATVHYMLEQNDQSLRDCDEVLKRNCQHFGALSGAGQIHLQWGEVRLALDFLRRAVQINPSLAGPAQLVPMLEQHLQGEDRDRT